MRQFIFSLMVSGYRITPIWLRKFLFRIRYHKQNTTPPKRISFGISLTEHCNLKCKGCDHFSPLAPKSELQLESFTNDMRRMSQLFGADQVKEVFLLGGEPLLHPRLCEFFPVARSAFPHCPIRLLTNGLLLMSMPDDFWKSCAENEIEIAVTKYPVKMPFEKIEQKAEQMQCRLVYFNGSSTVLKTLYKEPIDLKGLQDPVQAYSMCSRAYCYTLKDGKLYHCTLIPCMETFTSYFGIAEAEVDESDYVDIYQVCNCEEAKRKLASPGRFCRYCDIGHNEFGLKWERSRCDIHEWIREERK